MNRIKFMRRLSLSLDYLSSFSKSYTRLRLPYKKSCKGLVRILATGPSLNDCLPELLANATNSTFLVLNDFALSDIYSKLRPKYYIMIDPAYFLPKESISERDFENSLKVFESINHHTTWNMELIVPSSKYQQGNIKMTIKNKNVKLLPVNLCQLTQVDDPWYYKMMSSNRAASFSNVLGAAIYVCVNLGFNEIRLYGADHSWTKDIRVNDQNQVCTVCRHFYDDEEELIPWKTSDNRYFEMYQILQALGTHFLTYKLLQNYAKMHSCRIINCTPGSYIDAFERC